MIDKAASDMLERLIAADGASFVELAALAGLDPARDFRCADLRGVDFGDCDLAGFDFSGADLSGADLHRVSIEGAWFADIHAAGARWPQDAPPGSIGPRLMRSGSPLRHHQMGMVHAIGEALAAGVRYPSACLAAGTGRTGALAGLIEALDEAGTLDTMVVIVERLASLHQLLDALGQSFGSSMVGRVPTSPLERGPSARILVDTVGSVLRRREFPWLLSGRRVSHVVFDGIGSGSPAAIQGVEASYPGCAVITISSLPPNEMQRRVSAEEEGQHVLSEIVYSYPIASALRDGLLVSLPIESRWFDEQARARLERRPGGWNAVPEVVIHDIANRLARQSKPEPTIILCRDIATGKGVAERLERQLEAYGSGAKERLIRVVSSDDPSSRWALNEDFGDNAVFIMTPAMASGVDLRRMKLRIVLTTLSGSVLSAIAFRHSGPDDPEPCRIVDYVGAFNSDTVASFVGE